jgi:hypothetical protein
MGAGFSQPQFRRNQRCPSIGRLIEAMSMSREVD